MRQFTVLGMLMVTVQLLSPSASTAQRSSAPTITPVKHVVVIFDENNAFDHYFGAYPNAQNPPGEPPFHARPGTPDVNGLTSTLLNDNPNSVAPFRLDRS